MKGSYVNGKRRHRDDESRVSHLPPVYTRPDIRPIPAEKGISAIHLSHFFTERKMPAITKQRVNVKSGKKSGRRITAKRPVVKTDKFVGYEESTSGAWI